MVKPIPEILGLHIRIVGRLEILVGVFRNAHRRCGRSKIVVVLIKTVLFKRFPQSPKYQLLLLNTSIVSTRLRLADFEKPSAWKSFSYRISTDEILYRIIVFG